MKKINRHLQAVKVKCVANSDGYANGLVIKAGRKFSYKGNLKNGAFPLWCDPVDEFESEFSKLSEAEQAAYSAKASSNDEERSESVDVKAFEDRIAKLEAEAVEKDELIDELTKPEEPQAPAAPGQPAFNNLV